MDQAHRRNSFDALRLLGATLVLLGHSFALTGGKSPEILGQGFHIIGVKMFFIISGYLITKSWLRDPHGMYLIAFPTQQTIVHLVPNIGPAALTIFALCVTVPLAALSWICVEAPMLGLLRQIQRNYFIPRRASLGQ